ncbi:MAG: hypothetical protein AB7U45_09395 [Desulfamplus sp.]
MSHDDKVKIWEKLDEMQEERCAYKLRRNLTDKQQHRAEETLRIVNLNCRTGKLRYMRRAAVKDYLQTAEAFAEMALEFDEEEWRPLLEKELETIKKLPFSTAIRHILMSFSTVRIYINML